LRKVYSITSSATVRQTEFKIPWAEIIKVCLLLSGFRRIITRRPHHRAGLGLDAARHPGAHHRERAVGWRGLESGRRE
jgi:hypothetical protein